MRPHRGEEPIGEHHAGRGGQQQCQVGAGRLQGLPVRQPGAEQVQQHHQAEGQQGLADRQPQAAARAGVGEAREVVQDQHRQAAEQQAVDQGLALAGGGHHRRLQGDVGAQFVFGHQAYVDVQCLAALGQWQREVAAGQRLFRLGLAGAGVHLLDQLVAVEHVEIQVGQVGSEDPQDLLMGPRLELEAQPQGAVGLGGGELVQFDGAELVGVARGTDVTELQVALIVEQHRPATALSGQGRIHAEQGQQCDGEA